MVPSSFKWPSHSVQITSHPKVLVFFAGPAKGVAPFAPGF
jgi:hypothetical protein